MIEKPSKANLRDTQAIHGEICKIVDEINDICSIIAPLRSKRDAARAKIEAKRQAELLAKAKAEAKEQEVAAAKKLVAEAEAKAKAEAEARKRAEAQAKEAEKRLAAAKKLLEKEN